MSYFPIAIVEEGTCTLRVVDSPEQLPNGVPFRVILTNADPNDCRLIDDVLKKFKDKLGPYHTHISR